MILAVAATEFEMDAYLRAGGKDVSRVLVTGVGLLESCLKLTRYLEQHRSSISAIVNFGVAGAYLRDSATSPDMLDICIARQEVFGDLGIYYPRRLDELGDELALKKTFSLDERLIEKSVDIFKDKSIAVITGNFVTVSCVSGTHDRGEMLRQKYDGLCENMEGAAIARVCQEYSLPCMELRCVSNFVEDRDPTRWRLEEACHKAGDMTALVIKNLG